MAKLRAHDWAKEFEEGKNVWRRLFARAIQVQIPDPGVKNAYYACLGDTFNARPGWENG